MHRPIRTRALAVLGLALGATLALASLAYAQMRGRFEDADANHDGRVSLEEYEAYAKSRLLAAKGPNAERFKQFAPDEQAARLKQRFDRADKSHKGYLEPSDWGRS